MSGFGWRMVVTLVEAEPWWAENGEGGNTHAHTHNAFWVRLFFFLRQLFDQRHALKSPCQHFRFSTAHTLHRHTARKWYSPATSLKPNHMHPCSSYSERNVTLVSSLKHDLHPPVSSYSTTRDSLSLLNPPPKKSTALLDTCLKGNVCSLRFVQKKKNQNTSSAP